MATAQHNDVDQMENDVEQQRPTDEKMGRLPMIGDHVYFWRAGTGDIGPSKEPCHAVVASINAQGLVTLGILTPIGTWRQEPGVKFSEEPKTRHWTWPK